PLYNYFVGVKTIEVDELDFYITASGGLALNGTGNQTATGYGHIASGGLGISGFAGVNKHFSFGGFTVSGSGLGGNTNCTDCQSPLPRYIIIDGLSITNASCSNCTNILISANRNMSYVGSCTWTIGLSLCTGSATWSLTASGSVPGTIT